MKDKKQRCPKCKNLMSYRGSRVFYCKYCKIPFLKTRAYVKTERDPMTLIKRSLGMIPSNWRRI